MFSANPSISPIGLKPLDMAKRRRNGVGLGGNRVGLGVGLGIGFGGRTGGVQTGGRTRWLVKFPKFHFDLLTYHPT